jgi:predicted TPR repeat methyltransferase
MYRQVLRITPDSADAHYLLASVGGLVAPPQSPADFVISLFDSIADTFDKRLVGELRYHAPELLEMTVKQILGDKAAKLVVLDLGCGTGLCGPLFRDISQQLIGVDLSPRMLEKARTRNVYDELIHGDVMQPLSSPSAVYDLVISTDVFIYIGDLEKIFHACSAVLRSGGLFAFSIETTNESRSYVLRPTGRYAQSISYIRNLACATSLKEIRVDNVILRREQNEPVSGSIIVLQKP